MVTFGPYCSCSRRPPEKSYQTHHFFLELGIHGSYAARAKGEGENK